MGDQSKFLEEICVVTTELRVAAREILQVATRTTFSFLRLHA
jgi:hypothetical protein